MVLHSSRGINGVYKTIRKEVQIILDTNIQVVRKYLMVIKDIIHLLPKNQVFTDRYYHVPSLVLKLEVESNPLTM